MFFIEPSVLLMKSQERTDNSEKRFPEILYYWSDLFLQARSQPAGGPPDCPAQEMLSPPVGEVEKPGAVDHTEFYLNLPC